MQHTVPRASPPASLPSPKDASLPNFKSCALRRTATDRSSNSQQRSRRAHGRQRSLSPQRSTMISTEEFEALPQSIQKKYFSPVERLRINQQSLAKKRSKQSMKGAWLASSSQVDVTVRPSTAPGLPRPSFSFKATKQETSFASQLTLKQTDISEEQARWFLTLPEKIRRQQFTREEQITLVVRCKKALEFSSPDLARDAYRRCCPNARPRSRMSWTSKHRPSTSIAASIDEGKSFLDLDTASVHTTDTSNAEMKIFNMYSRRSDSITTDQDRIETIPPAPPVEDLIVPTPPKRLPFRRLSLAPLRLPPPKLAPPMPPLPPLSPIRSIDSSRPISFAARLSKPSMDFLSSDSDLELESSAESRSYHDEDVRKQLRKTLASPEKFEEALEFGFAKKEPLPTPPPPTDTYQFLAHDPEYTDSDSGDYGEDESDYTPDDDDTSVEPASPRTPTPVSDTHPTAIKLGSFDSGISMPAFGAARLKTPRLSPASSIATREAANREMTIHLTLTRPDLRSPEDELYSVQRQQTSGVAVERVDPLALQSLPVCDDATGAHGAFAVPGDGWQGKGLKKVWKRVLKY